MHLSSVSVRLFASLLGSLFCLSAFAQNQPSGSIVGQISNQATGVYLEGATLAATPASSPFEAPRAT